MIDQAPPFPAVQILFRWILLLMFLLPVKAYVTIFVAVLTKVVHYILVHYIPSARELFFRSLFRYVGLANQVITDHKSHFISSF